MPASTQNVRVRIHALKRFGERFFIANRQLFDEKDQIFLAAIMYNCAKLAGDKERQAKYEAEAIAIEDLPGAIKDFFWQAYTSGVGAKSINDPLLRKKMEEKQQKSNHDKQGWYFFKSFKKYTIIFHAPRYDDTIYITTVYENEQKYQFRNITMKALTCD